MKRNVGFTLIELIVVIAILAVLAGVAIPVYSGYVRRAKDAQVLVALDAVATAAQAANAEGEPITEIIVSENGKRIEFKTGNGVDGIESAFNKNFSELYGCTYSNNLSYDVIVDLSGSSFENGAVWYAYATGNHESGWHPS